jgi:hypothetical protein
MKNNLTLLEDEARHNLFLSCSHEDLEIFRQRYLSVKGKFKTSIKNGNATETYEVMKQIYNQWQDKVRSLRY